MRLVTRVAALERRSGNSDHSTRMRRGRRVPRDFEGFPGHAGSTVVPALRPYQREIAAAILESIRAGAGRSYSVMVSRQGGKNELSAQLEASLLLRAPVGGEGLKAAPTLNPQGKVSLRRLLRVLRALRTRPLMEEGRIVVVGGARMVFLSAGKESNVVGHTASLVLEVDEAQDVDAEKFDKEFRPMASTTNATIVYYGTAWAETDLLAEMKARHLELERQDGIRRHFEFDWREVARFNPAYAAFVAGERERLGEDHPLFQTQYLLRPLAGSGRFFTPVQRALLAGTHPRESSPSAAAVRGLGYVAGLDVGGEAFRSESVRVRQGARPDATVLMIGRLVAPVASLAAQEAGVELVQIYEWVGTPHTELVGAVAGLLRDLWRVRRVAVDATGVGEGLASALASLPHGPEVERLRVSEARKSELGYQLQSAAGSGRLRVFGADGSPEHRELWKQVELARATYGVNQRLAWGVAEVDGNDDHLFSLALVVEAAKGLGTRLARGRLED